jgi:hypothetical protein
LGPRAGAAYVIGTRANVRNDKPIIGHYGVNNEGSHDMYPKGGNMLHMIRQIVGNDSTWRSILRGLNATFWHRIVTGREVQDYITLHSGIDLRTVFEQYLTTTQIPALEYTTYGHRLRYRWANVVPGFDMPVRVTLGAGRSVMLSPRTRWQTISLPKGVGSAVRVDEGFYVIGQRLDAPPRCALICAP